MAQEATAAARRARADVIRERRRAAILRTVGLCKICKGKSPQWKVGSCPNCNNTGKVD